MMVFYVDEAGCLGTLPTATSPIQPVFAIAGIVLRRECLHDFTLDWLDLKERFFPNLRPVAADFLDWNNRLMEMPMFGHSDNHAGIQAADMICSAFLFPMATFVYCQGHVTNLHVDLQYYRIRDLFGDRLKRLQFRYQDANQWWRGGITVSDALGHQRGGVLFGP
jgi:hypothetical protein